MIPSGGRRVGDIRTPRFTDNGVGPLKPTFPMDLQPKTIAHVQTVGVERRRNEGAYCSSAILTMQAA